MGKTDSGNVGEVEEDVAAQPLKGKLFEPRRRKEMQKSNKIFI